MVSGIERTPIQMMQDRQDLYNGALGRTEARIAQTREFLKRFEDREPTTPGEIKTATLAEIRVEQLGIGVNVLNRRIGVLQSGIDALEDMHKFNRLLNLGKLSDKRYARVQECVTEAQALIAPKAAEPKYAEPIKPPAAPAPQISFVVSTDSKGANISGDLVRGNFGLYVAGIANAFNDGQTKLSIKELQQLLPQADVKSKAAMGVYIRRAQEIFAGLGFKVTFEKPRKTIKAMVLEGTLSQPVPDLIINLPVIRLGDLLYVNGILFQKLNAEVLKALAPTYLTKPPKYVPRANIQDILEEVKGAQIPKESLRALTSSFLTIDFGPRLNRASLALESKRDGRSLLYRLIDSIPTGSATEEEQTVTPTESASEDVKKKPSAPLK